MTCMGVLAQARLLARSRLDDRLACAKSMSLRLTATVPCPAALSERSIVSTAISSTRCGGSGDGAAAAGAGGVALGVGVLGAGFSGEAAARGGTGAGGVALGAGALGAGV